MSNVENKWIKIAEYTAKAAITMYATYYLWQLSKSLAENQNMSKEQKKSLGKKLKRSDIVGMEFTAYEGQIAGEIQTADEISTTFEDIGGLSNTLEDVRSNVLLPLKVWHRIKHQNKSVPIPSGKNHCRPLLHHIYSFNAEI